MILKKYLKAFDLETALEDEQVRFINRVNTAILDLLDSHYEHSQRLGLIRYICYELGCDPHKYIHHSAYGSPYCDPIRKIPNNNFRMMLPVLTACYKWCLDYDKPESNIISARISDAIDKSAIELGVKWVSGNFIPSSAEVLDKALIEDQLGILDEFPNEKIDFENALQHFLSKQYAEVIGNCYNTIEGVARQVLNNKKVLAGNKDLLLAHLDLSKTWSVILNNFIEYANNYKRHASESRHQLKPIEVESFLYLTGLICNLIIKSDKGDS